MTTDDKHAADNCLDSMSISAATVTTALRAAVAADEHERPELLQEALDRALRAQAGFDHAHARLQHIFKRTLT